MFAGTVKWYDSKKGYGFIFPDGGGKDVFVHVSALQASSLDTLNEDDRLLYELEDRPGGKVAAINLRPEPVAGAQ